MDYFVYDLLFILFCIMAVIITSIAVIRFLKTVHETLDKEEEEEES